MGRPGLNRTAVIAAAADLADEIGFDAVTISVLARHLGIKSPTLYSHITGATDLRTAVTAYVLHELADATTTAMAAAEGRDLLAPFADAIRDFARRSPGRYDATTRQRVPPAEAGESRTDSVEEAITAGRRNADLALAVIRGYDIPESEETYAVRLMSSLIHGYVTLELAGSFAHSDPPSDATWPEVLDELDGTLGRMALGRPH
ncbi:TetR-like C-terminal domain-containing protein [Nocardioides sp. NPDC057577]|uniref:TetR-like C-terminal domain-containing protein n=1 Tax=Nocardioides sp. NPDC057577 TaxID=3346171 RepID=UPI00366BBDCB